MKKLKIATAVLLVVVLIISSVSVYCATDNTSDFVPPPGFDNDDVYIPLHPVTDDAPGASTSDIKYDPRLKNETTKVENQGQTGTCALFATNAVFERAVYNQTGLKYNYSEEAMRCILSSNLSSVNSLSGAKGFYSYSSTGGRSYEAAVQYLTNFNAPIIEGNNVFWYAPNYESAVPFTDNSLSNYLPSGLDSRANAYVAETIRIRNDDIKYYVALYGAVYDTIYSAFSDNYNPTTSAFCVEYKEKVLEPDHAVAIVGWDDKYSRLNFNEKSRPLFDGAWLVRNSWGEQGDGGYYWVSYYDDSLLYYSDAAAITKVNKMSKNEHMLSYDFLPMTNRVSYDTGSEDYVYICNVYDVSQLSEYDAVTKVMFYLNNIGGFYRVYLAPVGNDGTMPDVRTLNKSLAYGSVDHEGYITVDLNTMYEIDHSFDKYAVIIKLFGYDNTVTFSQESTKNSQKWVNYSKEGESYIYEDNKWKDVAKGESGADLYNFCIRPVLRMANKKTVNSAVEPKIAVNTGEKIKVSIEKNGNELYSIYTDNGILYEDTDFTRDGDSIVFEESFLNSISGNSTDVYFEFTDSEDQTLRILAADADSDKIICGDVDRDGQVSVLDATIIQMHLASLATLSELQEFLADVDADAKVSVLDSTDICRFVAKLISSFKAE